MRGDNRAARSAGAKVASVARVGGRVRIGISSWRYAPWRHAFYPQGLAQHRELAFAAQHFSTIEINGSFYSLQRPDFYARWYEQTPPGFVFAVKGGRFITHMKKLRDVDEALANFLRVGAARAAREARPGLVAVPRAHARRPRALRRFLRGRWPLFEDVTSDFVYVRLHGDKALYASGYSDAALARWARRIELWSRGRAPVDACCIDRPAAPCAARYVYVYFDNDIKVYAPFDALELQRALGQDSLVPGAPLASRRRPGLSGTNGAAL